MSRVEKARRLMEDNVILAMQLQQDFDDEGEARRRLQTQHRNNKSYANKLALESHQQTPLLKLLQEILNIICEYVFEDTVLQITMDTRDFPYTKTTFKIATYKFISILDTWQYPILSRVDEFLDTLDSIPVGINIARFDIVSVMKGPWSDELEVMNTSLVEGFDPAVDYNAKLEKEILGLFSGCRDRLLHG
ncbi:hypothetical protein G6514_001811 [Epicoccum nigrum]|nr:hypothetical protein G6514_001811 [Epicoccum nigrum]